MRLVVLQSSRQCHTCAKFICNAGSVLKLEIVTVNKNRVIYFSFSFIPKRCVVFYRNTIAGRVVYRLLLQPIFALLVTEIEQRVQDKMADRRYQCVKKVKYFLN